MSKKLTITVDDEVYAGLHSVIGRRRISRFLNDLARPHVLHGDLAAAIVDNVFLLVGLPLLVAWLLVRWRRGQALMPVPAIVVITVAASTWTVVRNLPGFPLVPTLLTG